jgi:hypothetical protein
MNSTMKKKVPADPNTASGVAKLPPVPAASRRIASERKALARLPKAPIQPASGQADHARHHVALNAQSA